MGHSFNPAIMDIKKIEKEKSNLVYLSHTKVFTSCPINEHLIDSYFSLECILCKSAQPYFMSFIYIYIYMYVCMFLLETP